MQKIKQSKTLTIQQAPSCLQIDLSSLSFRADDQQQEGVPVKALLKQKKSSQVLHVKKKTSLAHSPITGTTSPKTKAQT